MKKILVVDDDLDDLKTMEDLLKKAGYDVVAAADGAKALDSLKEDNFNLILIDIKMPTLSGYDLLRLIRERVNHNMAMIYVSIIPEQEVDMEDVDGFIQKPFSPDFLLSMVKEVLKE